MRLPRLAGLLVLALAPACSHPVPLYCDATTPCTDPDRPFCDLTGEFPASEGISNTCIPDPDDDDGDGEPNACATPGEALRCEGNLLVECTDDSVEQTSTCPLGCLDDERRCIEVRASNRLDDFLDVASDAPALLLGDGDEIDTSSGEVRIDNELVLVPSFTLFQPEGFPTIRVFVVSSFSLPEGELRVTGDSAFAVLSDREITIDGVLSAPGSFVSGGPGALYEPNPCVGRVGDEFTDNNGRIQAAGSSGGSNATAGGRGGTVDFAIAGPVAGDVIDNPDLVPLHGGCSGGPALYYDDINGGGGAVQLVSREAVRVRVGGSIDVSGGGSSFGNPRGAGGGGAGGSVLIEAPEVEIAGNIFANGGAGACVHRYGEGGLRAVTPTPGADCSSVANRTNGGAGAARDVAAEDGGYTVYNSSVSQLAGGGGGGGGYIVLKDKDGNPTIRSTSAISPAYATGRIETF